MNSKTSTKAKDGPAYTGKQLFSLFFQMISIIITSKWSKGTGPKNDVVIKNGELISGVIDKTSIGAEEPESVFTELLKIMEMEKLFEFILIMVNNSLLIMDLVMVR